ncbi:MAG: 5'-nucleotidase C-terminal domain-containing protein [Leptolyngbyaceae cyanobacterium bins.59]|nr:5'-nucleotidase C-terminal domain-containing protein [Leptolyngbyaceae cyanobacterium bins.59]
MAAIRLQILHASDFEGGIPAIDDAVRFSAVLNALRNDTGLPANLRANTPNTLTLSSGDNYIPGVFLNASSDPALNNVGGLATSTAPVAGRADIAILNNLGIQASALGNHEFDLGPNQVASLLGTLTAGQPVGPEGTTFPYLSANLNFAPESSLAPRVPTNPTTAEANTLARRVARSTFIRVPGPDGLPNTPDDERIGVVGATTPTLRSISSPGNIGVNPANPTDYDALAAEIQTAVDALVATGIDKVVLLSHMQQLNIESEELARRLRNVDVIIAGGSHTLLKDENDPFRGDNTDTLGPTYPIQRTGADGRPVLVVNTAANYRYVGRLVVDFDANGVINTSALNSTINGAYATDQAGVERFYGAGANAKTAGSLATNTNHQNIVSITTGIQNLIGAKDNTLFGKTSVFLNGTRNDVRTRETNFGSLTADANLFEARKVDPTVIISLKNGGGIRDNIGSVSAAPGATDPNAVLRLPPQPNPLAPDKREGDISQLDIENSLRFNNALSLITVTAIQLKDVMEHGVAATTGTATPGQFPQVGGMVFSFDPSRTARVANATTGVITTPGDRIRSLAIVDAAGNVTDTIVQNGQIVGDPNRTFRMVTLNFLLGTTPTASGDSYPFWTFIRDNPTLANRVDFLGETAGTLSVVDLNRNGRVDPAVSIPQGRFNFAQAGTEQDAFAEYMGTVYANTPYSGEDVSATFSPRIQNLSVSGRTDTVLRGPIFRDGNTFVVNNALQLQFTLASRTSTQVNEIGVFSVDSQGRVGGVAPTAGNAYLQAILNQSDVLLSAITNAPTGFVANTTRTLTVTPGERLQFFLVPNGTIAGAQAALSAGRPPDIRLASSTTLRVSDLSASSFSLGWEDGTDSDFDDVVIQVQSTPTPPPAGTALQVGAQPELLDLRNFTGNRQVTFTVNREAAFDNFVGFYTISDNNGGIDTDGNGTIDVRPGEAGYIRAALQRRVQGVDLSVSNQATATFNAQLAGGSVFAPFIVVNGRPEALLDTDTSNDPAIYFPFIGANPGRVDHIRLLGDNVFGFEDLPNGGDLDYNDVIVRVSVTG